MLVGKGYAAAGQAGSCLHTLVVLQAYQADLLKELDEGEGFGADDICELRRTADLSLRATKETARTIGRSMAALVAAERHLWLTLSDIKDRDRVFLLDAPLSPSGLFGDAVDAVVDRHQEAGRQAVAFQRFLPRHSLTQGAAGREQPLPRAGSSYREAQKESVAACAPPRRRGRGGKKGARSRPPSLSRICGLFFRRRGLRLRSPDVCGPGLMRVAPAGVEQRSPQRTVPVSPQCLQEIDLPALPHMVFQGAAVSSEHISQSLPPGNVAELRCSPPLRGSLQQPVRLSPAGVPFQDTKLATLITPEASLERLVPLVHYLAAWKLLPNVSRWVLRTVERGYRIQFGSHPPQFNGVNSTLVGPEQALVMEQEVNTLLRKEAIEVAPPHERESGFYSRYFIVPKKDGGLRPILDLRQLNRSRRQTEVQDAYTQAGRVSNQVRGLVCRD